MINLNVVNIVVMTDLKHNLQLETIAAKLSNTEYNPEQFPGLVLRIKDPKISALLFTSGKIICTGARNMTVAHEAIQKILELLKKNGILITIKPKLTVQNMVGSGEVGFDLNLNKLAMQLDNVEFEPEQFPGLVYKITYPFHSTFLLFSNGKVVCTGAKTENGMNICFEQLIKNLNKVMIKVKH